MARSRSAPRELLKDLEVTILIALAEGPMHGYALLQHAIQDAAGFVPPGPTSLYRTIGALVDEGLIEEVAAPAGSTDDRRRYYRQTPAGRAALRAELTRLTRIVSRARALGITPEPGSR